MGKDHSSVAEHLLWLNPIERLWGNKTSLPESFCWSRRTALYGLPVML